MLEELILPARYIPGETGTVCFAGLPAGVKDVEIWLPQWVKCELVALRADAPIEPPTPSGRPVWLHHGSSISQCNGADSPTAIWPAAAARLGGVATAIRTRRCSSCRRSPARSPSPSRRTTGTAR